MASRAPTTSGVDIADLLDFLRSMLWGCWRFRWHAVGFAWALCLAGWAVVALLPDVHRASARVYVDTQNALRPLLANLTVNSDVMTDVTLMERAMLSRPNLEQLARDTDLDLGAIDKSQFDGLIAGLRASIRLERDGANIVRISYEHRDSDKALVVVTSLLNSFIEGSLGENRTDSSAAEKFLVEKLGDYERRLTEAEAKLAEFKRRNVGLMPGEDADYFARLQTESTRLQELDSRLRSARNRRAELQRQLEGEEPVFGLVPADEKASLAAAPQDRQIAQFEQELASLRLKYTESHPGIVQIKKTIADLKAEKEAAVQSGASSRRAYSPLDLNPVYQQMKMQLSQVEVELAQLQAEYGAQAGVVSGLRRKLDVVPAIEAELKRLTRDYDVNRTQYDEMLRRVESARLSEDADQSKSDITFRIIDPPTVPALPVGPPRGLLATAVLLLALGAGAGLALALNLMTPVFYTGKDLERRFGVPVLGTVRLAQSEADLTAGRQRTLWVAASLGALVLCYGLLVTFGISPSAAGGV